MANLFQSMKAYYDQHHLMAYFPETILASCHLKTFDKGSAILSMGDPVEALYCLVEGRSKTYFTTENGRQLLLSFQDAFKFFGELEIFEETPEATNTVEAVTACTCIVIPRTVVLSELVSSAPFLKALSMSLGKKLGRVIRNSALNTLNPVETRLASYIMATVELEADRGAGGFKLNLSQIADQLGTSFRHLHRTMQILCDQGIVEKRGTCYAVLDFEQLKILGASSYVFS